MGILDSFINTVKLKADEPDNYDDYDNDRDYDEEPVVRKSSRKKEKVQDTYDEPEVIKKDVQRTAKITPMRSVKKTTANGSEVCVIRPTSLEDGREITETLLANCSVILNLEGLDINIAQRIIDFTSGSCFAINGQLHKVTNYVFVVAPPATGISGDILEEATELLGTFNSSGLHLDL